MAHVTSAHYSCVVALKIQVAQQRAAVRWHGYGSQRLLLLEQELARVEKLLVLPNKEARLDLAVSMMGDSKAGSCSERFVTGPSSAEGGESGSETSLGVSGSGQQSSPSSQGLSCSPSSVPEVHLEDPEPLDLESSGAASPVDLQARCEALAQTVRALEATVQELRQDREREAMKMQDLMSRWDGLLAEREADLIEALRKKGAEHQEVDKVGREIARSVAKLHARAAAEKAAVQERTGLIRDQLQVSQRQTVQQEQQVEVLRLLVEKHQNAAALLHERLSHTEQQLQASCQRVCELQERLQEAEVTSSVELQERLTLLEVQDREKTLRIMGLQVDLSQAQATQTRERLLRLEAERCAAEEIEELRGALEKERETYLAAQSTAGGVDRQ